MKCRLCSLLRHAALPLVAALVSFTFPLHAGTHVWAGGDYLWSKPGNWLSGGAPQVGEAAPVILVFPAAGAKFTTNDLPGLVVDGIQITGDNYAFGTQNGASFQFRGDWQVLGNGIAITNATARLYGDVTVAGQTHFTGWNSTLVFIGAIGGSGWLSLEYVNAEFTGTPANTFAGLLWLQYGELRLNKTNTTAIAGKLSVGTPSGLPDTGRVRLNRADQISNSSEIDVMAGGWLDFNGFNDAVGNLEISGGRITTGAGTLSLAGTLTTRSNAQPAVIEGKLSLGVGSRVLTVEDGPALEDLWIKAEVSGIANCTKQGAGLMTLSGNNTFTSTLRLNEGTVLAQSSTALGGALGATYVTNNATLLLFPTTYPNGETLSLAGSGWQGQGALQLAQDNATWQGPIVLAGDAIVSVPSNSVLEASGVISGPGGLRLEGGGELLLDGSSANTHTGTNVVSHGRLRLNKSLNLPALAGALVVGNTHAATPEYAQAVFEKDNQLPTNAPVRIYNDGLAILPGTKQTFGPLTLELSSRIRVETNGVLTLPSLVRVEGDHLTLPPLGAIQGGYIYGEGEARLAVPTTFHVDAELPALSGYPVQCKLTGAANASLTKTGPAALVLGDYFVTNTFDGEVIVKEARLVTVGHGALGSVVGGTTVTNQGCLVLRNSVLGEPLTIATDAVNPPDFNLSAGAWTEFTSHNTNVWSGPVTLLSDARIATQTNEVLELTGVISGPGGIRLPDAYAGSIFSYNRGTVRLLGTAANSYAGSTVVGAATLQLGKSSGVAVPGALQIGDGTGALNSAAVLLLNHEQIHDLAAVTIATDGTLDLNHFAEFIGSLAGSGRVYCHTNTLTFGANSQGTVWSGGISGSGDITLQKLGTGTFQVTSDNFYSGKTLVQSGWFDVRGSLSSSQVRAYNTGTLMGTGAVGSLQNNNGGTVSPGASVGALASGDFSMAAPATFRVELNGTQGDQLNVVGTVALAGTLQVLPTNASPVGTTLVIINNDGADAVSGTFSGLPQNAEFVAGGQRFRISYTGGTGNDVVLTHVNTPPSLSSVTATAFADEGSSVHLHGAISDPDTADTFALVVNWGDGSAPQTFSIPAGSTLFHVEHVYADDKPGAQPSDNFTIEYTLTDTSGSPAFGQLNTVIGNVAPSFGALGGRALKAGQPLNTSVPFTDPGSDTWTATVDYGDGTGAQPLVVGPGRSLALNHTFPTNGTYTVTMNVSDDDAGTGTGTLTVHAGLELTIARRNATHATVNWPSVFTGFTLQSSPVLPGTNWATVAGAPAQFNATWQMTVPSTNGHSFFRLVK